MFACRARLKCSQYVDQKHSHNQKCFVSSPINSGIVLFWLKDKCPNCPSGTHVKHMHSSTLNGGVSVQQCIDFPFIKTELKNSKHSVLMLLLTINWERPWSGSFDHQVPDSIPSTSTVDSPPSTILKVILNAIGATGRRRGRGASWRSLGRSFCAPLMRATEEQGLHEICIFGTDTEGMPRK